MTVSHLDPPSPPDDLDAGRLLHAARRAHADAEDGQRRLLLAAAAWAAAHEVDVGARAAPYWGEGGVALAGPSTPLVAEFCVAELASALGLSAQAGRSLLADVVELRHRLPLLWQQVQAGRLSAELAQRTVDLPDPGASDVDRGVGEATRSGPAQLDRLVDRLVAEARLRDDVGGAA